MMSQNEYNLIATSLLGFSALLVISLLAVIIICVVICLKMWRNSSSRPNTSDFADHTYLVTIFAIHDFTSIPESERIVSTNVQSATMTYSVVSLGGLLSIQNLLTFLIESSGTDKIAILNIIEIQRNQLNGLSNVVKLEGCK
jgi:hypothetical protein